MQLCLKLLDFCLSFFSYQIYSILYGHNYLCYPKITFLSSILAKLCAGFSYLIVLLPKTHFFFQAALAIAEF